MILIIAGSACHVYMIADITMLFWTQIVIQLKPRMTDIIAGSACHDYMKADTPLLPYDTDSI